MVSGRAIDFAALFFSQFVEQITVGTRPQYVVFPRFLAMTLQHIGNDYLDVDLQELEWTILSSKMYNDFPKDGEPLLSDKMQEWVNHPYVAAVRQFVPVVVAAGGTHQEEESDEDMENIDESEEESSQPSPSPSQDQRSADSNFDPPSSASPELVSQHLPPNTHIRFQSSDESSPSPSPQRSPLVETLQVPASPVRPDIPLSPAPIAQDSPEAVEGPQAGRFRFRSNPATPKPTAADSQGEQRQVLEAITKLTDMVIILGERMTRMETDIADIKKRLPAPVAATPVGAAGTPPSPPVFNFIVP